MVKRKANPIPNSIPPQPERPCVVELYEENDGVSHVFGIKAHQQSIALSTDTADATVSRCEQQPGLAYITLDPGSSKNSNPHWDMVVVEPATAWAMLDAFTEAMHTAAREGIIPPRAEQPPRFTKLGNALLPREIDSELECLEARVTEMREHGMDTRCVKIHHSISQESLMEWKSVDVTIHRTVDDDTAYIELKSDDSTEAADKNQRDVGFVCPVNQTAQLITKLQLAYEVAVANGILPGEAL